MAAVTPLLIARGMGRRRADSSAWLLRDVYIDVRPGERLALVGPSGVGKTLLLRALAFLDPLDCGEVLWRGRTVASSSIPEYRRHVVYVSQRPVMVEGTVEENLRLPYTLEVHRGHVFDKPRVRKMLARLGRSENVLSTDSRHVSGGEAQITALVRALQFDPAVLLLDEPTASLDHKTELAVESMIADWIKSAPDHRAAIWTSHDPRQTQRIASRRVEMTAGGKVVSTSESGSR